MVRWSTDLDHGPRHVVTVIYYRRIKHGSFPSLCIGENDKKVIECILFVKMLTPGWNKANSFT